MVFKVELYLISHTGSNKASGYSTVKGPVHITYPVTHLHFLFYNFHINNEFCRSPVPHGTWNHRRGSKLSFRLAIDPHLFRIFFGGNSFFTGSERSCNKYNSKQKVKIIDSGFLNIVYHDL